MSELLKLSLKNLKNNIGKTILILITLTIASALFFCTFQISNTLKYTEINDARAKNVGKSQAIILSKNENAVFKEKRLYNNFLKTTQVVTSYGTINKKNQNTKCEIKGVNYIDFKDMFFFSIIKDNNSSFTGKDIIIDSSLSEKYNLNVGDTLPLYINNKEYSFKIAKIAEDSDYFESDNTRVLIPIDTVREIMGISNEDVTEIYVNYKNNNEKNKIKNIYAGSNFLIKDSVSMDEINSDVNGYSMVLILILIFVVIISTAIIFTTFRIIVLQRLKLIGVLRSIGITKGKISFMFIVEGIIYSIIASIFSIILGNVINSVMMSSNKYLTKFDTINTISTSGIVIATILFTVILMILNVSSAVLIISKFSIKDMLNSVIKLSEGHFKKIYIILDVVFFLILALESVISKVNIIVAILMFILLLISFTCVISTVIYVMHLVLVKVKVRGIWPISLKNMCGNANLQKNIKLISIGGMIILLINIFSYSTALEVSNFYKNYKCDLIVTYNELSQKNIHEISNEKRVKGTYSYVNGETIFNKNTKVITNAIGNVNEFSKYLNLDIDWEDNYLNDFNKSRNVIITKIYANRYNLNKGSMVTLSSGGVSKKYTVRGIANSMINMGDTIYIPAKYGKMDFSMNNYNVTLVKSSNAKKTQSDIMKKFTSNDTEATIISEKVNRDRKSSSQIFMLFYIFAFVASAISIIGIVNNLIVSLLVRKKEICCMRAIGMNKGKVFRMLLYEAVFSGIISGIFASIGSIVLLPIISRILILIDEAMPAHFELKQSIFVFSITIIVSIISVIFTVFKILRSKIIEGIKYE